jgi:hypothetical protein
MNPDQRSAIAEAVDDLTNWIFESAVVGCMLVNDDPGKSAHMLTVGFTPIRDSATLGGIPDTAAYETELPDLEGWQFVLLGTSDLSSFFVSEDAETYVRIAVGDELPFRRKYFLWEVDADTRTVLIAYGSVHLQTRAVNALLKAYAAIGEKRYLELAHCVLLELLQRVEADGRFYVLYADQEGPKYKGRIQALVMYELWNYLQYDDDETIAAGLAGLAETFAHTTEQTINHRTSSNIGQLLTNLVVGTERFAPDEILAEIRDTLDTYEEDGNLSKSTRGSSNFPNYVPTYLSYDAMLLMRVSQFVLTDEIYRKVFPRAFEKSVQTRNDGQYLPRNLSTLCYALKLHGHVDERVSAWLEANAPVDRPPDDVWEALAMLESYAGFLFYEALLAGE